MGAASRTSTAAALRALDGVQAPSAGLGDELLSAARALGTSNQLVGVLADPAVPDEQRAALVERVFGGAGAQTRSVLSAVVAGRWSAPQDLVAAVEEVGYRALATVRNGRRPVAVAAGSAAATAARASASTDADALDAELFTVQQAIASDGRLELALGNAAAPVEVRLGLVDALLKGARPGTRAIVRHVVASPRGRKPAEALAQAQTVVAAARDRLVAVVQTASPLSNEQVSALAERLEAAYGRKIAVNQTVEPALLGGVRITIGDDVIDGTVRSRLDDLRLRLAG